MSYLDQLYGGGDSSSQDEKTPTPQTPTPSSVSEPSYLERLYGGTPAKPNPTQSTGEGFIDGVTRQAGEVAERTGTQAQTTKATTRLKLEQLHDGTQRNDFDSAIDSRLASIESRNLSVEDLLTEIDSFEIDGGKIDRDYFQKKATKYLNSREYQNLDEESKAMIIDMIDAIEKAVKKQIEVRVDDMEDMFDGIVSEINAGKDNATEFTVTLGGKKVVLIGTKQEVLEEILAYKLVMEDQLQGFIVDGIDMLVTTFDMVIIGGHDILNNSWDGARDSTQDFLEDNVAEWVGGLFYRSTVYLSTHMHLAIGESMLRRGIMDHVGRWKMSSDWHLQDFSRNQSGSNLMTDEMAEQRNEYNQRLEAIEYLKNKVATSGKPQAEINKLNKQINKLNNYLNSKSPTFWYKAYDLLKERGFASRFFHGMWSMVKDMPTIEKTPLNYIRFPKSWENVKGKGIIGGPFSALARGLSGVGLIDLFLKINPQSHITAEFNIADKPKDFLLDSVKLIYPSATRGADSKIDVPENSPESDLVKQIRSYIKHNPDLNEKQRADCIKNFDGLLKGIKEGKIAYGERELKMVIRDILDSYLPEDEILKKLREDFFKTTSGGIPDARTFRQYMRGWSANAANATTNTLNRISFGILPKSNFNVGNVFHMYRMVQKGDWKGNAVSLSQAITELNSGTRVKPNYGQITSKEFEEHYIDKGKERLKAEQDAKGIIFDLNENGEVRNNPLGEDPRLSENDPKLKPFVQSYVYYIDLEPTMTPDQEKERQERLSRYLKGVKEGEIIGTEAELKSDIYRIANGDVTYYDVVAELDQDNSLKISTKAYGKTDDVNKFMQMVKNRQWHGTLVELRSVISGLKATPPVLPTSMNDYFLYERTLDNKGLLDLSESGEKLSKKHFKLEQYGIFENGKIKKNVFDEHLKIADAMITIAGGESQTTNRGIELNKLFAEIEGNSKIDYPMDHFTNHMTEIIYEGKTYDQIKNSWDETTYNDKQPKTILSEKKKDLLKIINTEFNSIKSLGDEGEKTKKIKELKTRVEGIADLLRGVEATEGTDRIIFTNLNSEIDKLSDNLEITDGFKTEMKGALQNIKELIVLENKLNNKRISDVGLDTDTQTIEEKINRGDYQYRSQIIDDIKALSNSYLGEELNEIGIRDRLTRLKQQEAELKETQARKDKLDTERAQADGRTEAARIQAEATLQAVQAPLDAGERERLRGLLSEELDKLDKITSKGGGASMDDGVELKRILGAIDEILAKGVSVEGSEKQDKLTQARDTFEAIKQATFYEHLSNILDIQILLKDSSLDTSAITKLRTRITSGEFITESSFKKEYKKLFGENPKTGNAVLKQAGITNPKQILDSISDNTTLDGLKRTYPILNTRLSSISDDVDDLLKKLILAVQRGKVF